MSTRRSSPTWNFCTRKTISNSLPMRRGHALSCARPLPPFQGLTTKHAGLLRTPLDQARKSPSRKKATEMTDPEVPQVSAAPRVSTHKRPTGRRAAPVQMAPMEERLTILEQRPERRSAFALWQPSASDQHSVPSHARATRACAATAGQEGNSTDPCERSTDDNAGVSAQTGREDAIDIRFATDQSTSDVYFVVGVVFH